MEEEEGIESQIKSAMLSRAQHFTNQADSLTFESVRRLLEEDMGLDKHALDVHKKLVKQLLEKCLEGNNDENASKNSGETLEANAGSTKAEVEQSPKKDEKKKEPSIAEVEQSPKKDEKKKEPSIEDEDKMEDSPVMGLLTPNKSTKSEEMENQASEKKEIPSESKIKKAMWNRADYFKANSETITMAGVRRLLEEDLDLDTKTLDPMKKFINKQLDEVLFSESASAVKKKSVLNSKTKKTSKKSSASSASESEEIEEVKPKKIVVQKGKVEKSEGLKKRKAPVKETKVSNKKPKKITKTKSEENNEEEDGGNVSEDSKSESSAEKPVKKKEVAPTPAYGKQVEHLKSVIKSCGMTVPPVVYRKAKQVPDEKRESFLRKELEEILSKEGLSANPSEKEIKEVKKKKERAKELEGIDTSNIVFSSRRRSTTSFVPPPKPKITVESDSEDSEESEDSESDGDNNVSDDNAADDNNDSDNDNDNDNDVDEGEGDDNKTEEAKNKEDEEENE